jgi:hypothetical protein
VTADTISTSAADRTVAALRAAADGDGLFTPAQVAWIVQMDRECRGDDPDDPGFRELVWRSGWEAGYRARQAEENADYRLAVEQAEADPGRSDLRALIEVVDARRAADRAARQPRPGDFRGGRPLPGRQGTDHDELKGAA